MSVFDRLNEITGDFFQGVQAMFEAETAAEWERQNDPGEDAEKMKDAAEDVDEAYESIGNAMDSLCAAVKKTKDTFAEDRIASLMNELEDLQSDVLSMKYKLKRGEC